MAYRQLCAAAFVIFASSVACGGGAASSAVDPNVDDPSPPSADAPPSSADDSPPSSEDAPPSNPDTPPSSPDTPGGGGRLQQLCESACEVLETLVDCVDDVEVDEMSLTMCRDGGCSMAIDPGVDVPCLDQLEGLFGCIADLPNVCMPTQGQGEVCASEFEAFGECAEDADPNPNPDPDPPNCMAPSCNCGGEACAECFCENGGGADALEFCADVCPTQ